MQTISPNYSQHIIKFPELNITAGRIPHRIVIDSSNRDNKFRNPNSYVFTLGTEYRDIISIELVQGCIPHSGYIINENNNKLCFQESFKEILEIEIEPGDYRDPVILAEVIEHEMNLLGSSTYIVNANKLTKKFEFISNLEGGDHIFSLIFKFKDKNVGIGKKLGFDNINLLDKDRYESTRIWNLEDEKYVILKIGEAEIIDSKNKNLANSFAIIIFDVPLGDNQIINNAKLPRGGNIKYYNPPLGKLDRLDIKFLTESGKLYDFNGRDHILVFEIITLNSPGLYNNVVPI